MNPIQFAWEGIKIAFHAIGTNRLRSFLTMLGIATGIFVIVGILTMVNTLEVSITKGIASLGNTTIFVHHFPWAQGRNDWHKYFNRPKVSYREFQRLEKNLSGVEAMNYEIQARGQTVKAGRESASNVEVVGSTYGLGDIHSFEFEWGRYFSELEMQTGPTVCVLGKNLSENLFPDQPALDQYVQVKNKRLRVIGVLAKKGDAVFPGMPTDDNRVFVPYKLMPSIYNLNSRNLEKVITIKGKSYDGLERLENETIGIMRASRGLKPAIDNNFAINKQEALMSRFGSFFDNFAIGGAIISAFSILIAGFSIGMIMYISVRERTNEIGIQKALGSTSRFILYQFMSEAVLICTLGGLLGLLLVVIFGSIAQLLLGGLDLNIIVSYSTSHILLGLFGAAGIGLIAGIVPASIAAVMDPVEAIRFS